MTVSGQAVCKTVGLAYVGSNPTPATSKPQLRHGEARSWPSAEGAVCRTVGPAADSVMILSLLVKRPLTCTLSAKAGHVLRGTVCLTAGKPDGCAQYVPKFWPGTVLPSSPPFRACR